MKPIRTMVNAIKLVFLTLFLCAKAMAYDCEYQRDQNTQLTLNGTRNIEVQAGAGELKIIGEKGRTDISIQADLCSSDEEMLAEMSVGAKVDGDTAYLGTKFPKKPTMSWGDYYARINLTLLVPENAVLDVEDSSGAALIRDVAELKIKDSSGELEIERISGDVDVIDSSGALTLKKIKGNAKITDSSGGIYASDVALDLIVRADSSGEIDAKRIGQNVLVKRDSSGAINVKNVGGDFTVERDGSGGINYKNVVGNVNLPN